MQLLSDLTADQLKGTVGRAVRVTDPKHFFHGVDGRVVAIETGKSFTVNHSVIGHLLPKEHVVIASPLIDGKTGREMEQRLELRPDQLSLPDQNPERPSVRAANGLVIDVACRAV